MVNPVQPVGKRSLEPTHIAPAADRLPLASSAVTGPAAPPALSAPATVVPGRARHEARGERRVSSAEEARAHAEATNTAVRHGAAAAVAAQANVPADRAYALLFD
jgi:hypothetical protein